jgi:hypothetical protein
MQQQLPRPTVRAAPRLLSIEKASELTQLLLEQQTQLAEQFNDNNNENRGELVLNYILLHYWCLFPSAHNQDYIPFHEYSKIYIRISKVLYNAEQLNLIDCYNSSLTDFTRDSKQTNGKLYKEAYFHSLIHTARIWTNNSTDIRIIINFLRSLYQHITGKSLQLPNQQTQGHTPNSNHNNKQQQQTRALPYNKVNKPAAKPNGPLVVLNYNNSSAQYMFDEKSNHNGSGSFHMFQPYRYKFISQMNNVFNTSDASYHAEEEQQNPSIKTKSSRPSSAFVARTKKINEKNQALRADAGAEDINISMKSTNDKKRESSNKSSHNNYNSLFSLNSPDCARPTTANKRLEELLSEPTSPSQSHSNISKGLSATCTSLGSNTAIHDSCTASSLSSSLSGGPAVRIVPKSYIEDVNSIFAEDVGLEVEIIENHSIPGINSKGNAANRTPLLHTISISNSRPRKASMAEDLEVSPSINARRLSPGPERTPNQFLSGSKSSLAELIVRANALPEPVGSRAGPAAESSGKVLRLFRERQKLGAERARIAQNQTFLTEQPEKGDNHAAQSEEIEKIDGIQAKAEEKQSADGSKILYKSKSAVLKPPTSVYDSLPQPKVRPKTAVARPFAAAGAPHSKLRPNQQDRLGTPVAHPVKQYLVLTVPPHKEANQDFKGISVAEALESSLRSTNQVTLLADGTKQLPDSNPPLFYRLFESSQLLQDNPASGHYSAYTPINALDSLVFHDLSAYSIPQYLTELTPRNSEPNPINSSASDGAQSSYFQARDLVKTVKFLDAQDALSQALVGSTAR